MKQEKEKSLSSLQPAELFVPLLLGLPGLIRRRGGHEEKRVRKKCKINSCLDPFINLEKHEIHGTNIHRFIHTVLPLFVSFVVNFLFFQHTFLSNEQVY
ncbi:MAG TPA: hypothetical protein DDW50_18770 [Firmicutes bacterium]|nr:hypothetical protein [Bacillota bacterium]